MPTTPSPWLGAPVPTSASNPENFGADMLAMATGLELGSIPLFPDYPSLVAAFPVTTPVEDTPPFARVYAHGDDFAVFYRLDPSGGTAVWTPMAGFAGLDDGDFDSAYVPIGVGGTTGLTSLTVANLGEGQAVVMVSAAARVNFATEDDVVEVLLRVKNGAGALTEVRRVTLPAPKSLQNSAVLPTFSFFVNGGDGFTLQTIFTRTGGTTGTCSASSEPRYTNLQYVAFTL